MAKAFLIVKNKEEAYVKVIEMSKNNDCTAGNLLDDVTFQNITN